MSILILVLSVLFLPNYAPCTATSDENSYPLYSFSRALYLLSSILNNQSESEVFFRQTGTLLSHIYTHLHNLSNSMVDQNSSDQCAEDIKSILNGLHADNSTTIEWLDSIGRPLPGVLGGAFTWPGSFQQCLSIPENTLMDGHHRVESQYCSLGLLYIPHGPKLMFSAPLGITLGVCMPRSCSTEQVIKDVSSVFKNIEVDVNPDWSYCHSSPQSLRRDTWFWITVTILILSGGLLASGCLFDLLLWLRWLHQVWQRERNALDQFIVHSTITGDLDDSDCLASSPISSVDALLSVASDLPQSFSRRASTLFSDYRADYIGQHSRWFGLIEAFSPLSNIRNLFYTTHPNAPLLRDSTGAKPLNCLNGIRFLSMCWVICGHCALAVLVSNNAILFVRENLNRWTFQVILNGTLASDTFFLMSGCLAVFNPIVRQSLPGRSFRSKVQFWIKHVTHRLLRLTPAYLFVLLLYTGLFRYLYDGPLYPQLEESMMDSFYCRRHWWATYLNNLIFDHELCMSWSWHLANEFQFSVLLAPLFLFLLTWNHSMALAFAVTLIASSIASTFGISYSKHYHPGLFSPQSFESIVIKPYTRWGTYGIGLILGWWLTSDRVAYVTHHPSSGTLFHTNRRLCPMRVALLGSNLCGRIMLTVASLCVSAVCCLSTVYGLKGVTESHPLANWVSALYNALYRPVFVTGITVIVVLCASGWAGHLDSLLSWPGFRVPARLTYVVYLIHPIVIYFIVLGGQMPLLLDDLSLVTLFFTVVSLSYLISFAISLITELPVIALEQLFQYR